MNFKSFPFDVQLALSEVDVPARLKPILESCPFAGEGVHRWLFTTALRLHRSGRFEHDEILVLLAIYSGGCGRVVSPKELADAVSDSGRLVSGSDHLVGPDCAMIPRPLKWSAMDPVVLDHAIAISPVKGMADLCAKSPVSCRDHAGDPEFYIDRLFPADPLLCVGKSTFAFWTASREEFRGHLRGMQLIVPSPMSAPTGPRKSDGKQSAHTLANTGPRDYLVTEFDRGTSDQQAALIGYLQARRAPLVMVLASAGKSLHAWWDCRGVDDEQVRGFMRLAVILGADSATWSRSQFVRLPEGWRPDRQALQTVHYFDPSILRKEEAQ